MKHWTSKRSGGDINNGAGELKARSLDLFHAVGFALVDQLPKTGRPAGTEILIGIAIFVDYGSLMPQCQYCGDSHTVSAH